ncbi:MAG: SurA N-terminal domain-containing protein [Rhodospirillales bacterium]
MLQAIRSKTASIVVKVLAGLLILSFAVWGIEDMILSKATDLSVASVGARDIDPSEFEYELSRETQRLRQTLGGQLTEEQLIGLGVGNAVLQRMINDAALSEKAESMGILVSDEQVTRAIHTDQAFQGFDGQFSRTRFNEMMRANGFPEQAYIERVRADIALRQMLGPVSSAAASPKKLSEMIRAFRYEKRTADTLLIKAADQPDPGQPDDAALKATYEDKPAQFTAPEYRKITFVHLDPKQLLDSISVTPEELKAAYDANQANFIKPEQRTVQQIVVVEEARATEATRMLAEGQDFKKVATDFAEMDEAAVDLGSVTPDGLLPDLSKAVFAAAKDAIIGPIKSPLGWHILKVTAIDAGFTKTLEEVRDQLTEIVRHEHAIDALYKLSVRFEDQIGSGATLEEAGAAVGAPAISIDAVDRDGKTPSGEAAKGLPNLASLLPVAFAAEERLESELTEAGDKGFFMVRVDKIIAPALKPLDSVRNEVIEVWKAEQRKKSAETQAREMAQLIAGGTAFASLAGAVPDAIRTVGPITRAERGEVEPGLLARMFELKPGGAGIALTGTDYTVIHLKDVIAPGSGADAPGIAEFDKQLDESVAQDLGAQLIESIRNELGVTVNTRVYNAVIKPGTFDPRQPL